MLTTQSSILSELLLQLFIIMIITVRVKSEHDATGTQDIVRFSIDEPYVRFLLSRKMFHYYVYGQHILGTIK